MSSDTRSYVMSRRRLAAKVLSLAALGALTATAVQAQTFQWDNAGVNAPAAGGTGIWDNVNARWFDGTVYGVWPNNTASNAVFGGTGGSVIVASGGVSANTLTFNTNYTLLNAGTTTGAAGASTSTITFGAGTINTGSNRVEIFNEFATSAGFTKEGSGLLILQAAQGGLTGPIVVNAGTLAIGNTRFAGFSNNASLTINAGATFDFGINGGAYGDTFGSLIGAGSMRLAGSPGFGVSTGTSLGIGADNGNGNFSGVISGAGGRLTKSGTGVATLSGASTYTGYTSITAGTLVIDSTGSISDQSAIFLSGTSNLTLNGNKTLGSLAGGSGTTIVDIGANNLTLGTDNRTTQYAGVLAGSGRVTKVGTGIQVFATTASTWTGGLTVKGGEFIASADTRFGAVPGAVTPDYIILDGGTVGNFANTGFTISPNRGITITANNGTIRASDKAATITYAGVITGAGKLTKIGPGGLSLSSNETYQGGTTVDCGTLSLTQTAGQIIGPGDVSLNSATLAFLPAAIAGNISASIADGSASNKFTYGRGANLFIGRNTNTSVALTVGNGAAAANSAFVRGTGGTLVVTPTNGIAELGGTGTNFIKVIANGGIATNVNGGTPATDGDMISGSVVSETSLTDLNGEFLRYDSTNGLTKASYSTSTDINSAGASAVYDAGSGANTNALTADRSVYGLNARNQNISGTGILTIGSGTGAAGVILSGGTISTTSLNFGNRQGVIYAGGGLDTAPAVNGISANITGTAGFTKVGRATLNVTGTSNVTGGINAMGGTLQLGSSNVFDASNALTIGHRGSIDLNGFAQTVASLNTTGSGAATVNLGSGGTLTVGSGNSTYRGYVTGSTGSMLVKDGSGVLTLGEDLSIGGVISAASSYQRLTVKNGGVVAISSGASLPPALASASALTDTITLDDGSLRINGVSNTLINSASTFTLGSTATSQRGLVLGAGGGTVDVTDALEIVFLQVDTATSRAIVTGPGNLTKTGAGFLRMGPGNTYTGKTIVLGGALQFPTDDSLGVAPGALVADQLQIGSFAMVQSNGAGNFAATRGTTLLAGGAQLNTSTGNLIFNGPITGPGGITKVGSGASVVRLNSANTFAGNLDIQNGIVELNVTGAAGLGNILLNPQYPVGISKTTAGDAVIDRPVQLLPGSYIELSVSAAAGTLELSGPITGTNRFFKQGGGTLMLSNTANSYTGDIIMNSGTIRVTSNNALGSSAGTTLVGSGATLAFDGGVNYTTAEPTSITGTGSSTGGAIRNVGGNNTYAGTVTLSGNAAIELPAGNLNLAGGIRGASDLTVNGVGNLNAGGIRVNTLNVNNPKVAINAGRSTAKTSKIGTLNLGANTLDLNDNDLVVSNTNETAVGALVTSGYASGAWTGTGITSTVAAANANKALGYNDAADALGAGPYPLPFSGVSVDSAADVLVRYTYRGDINLDGQVSSTDFNTFSNVANYGLTSGALWGNGDFDYDGKVNTVDFNYLAGNFGAAPIPSALPSDLPSGGASLGSVVPEPSSLSVLALGVAGLVARRRKA